MGDGAKELESRRAGGQESRRAEEQESRRAKVGGWPSSTHVKEEEDGHLPST